MTSLQITLFEKVNIELLNKIVDNFDELYPLLGRFVDSTKGYSTVDMNTAFTIVSQWRDQHLRSSEIRYSHSFRSKEGRLFSNGVSLQGISRVIRHTVSGEFYDDIDIQNAHPTFLAHLCKKHNLQCDAIEYYVKNTDKCRKELMEIYKITKDEAKTLLLRVLNKHDPKKHLGIEDPPSWFTAFYLQCFDARTKLTELHPNLKRQKTIKEDSAKWNIEGSICNHLFCVLENEILMNMLQFCKTQGSIVGALCFDGLMVEKDTTRNNVTFLRDMESYIKEKNQIKIVLSVKAMNEGISLDGYDVINVPPIKHYIKNDDEARHFLLNELSPFLKKSRGVLYYNNSKSNHKWIRAFSRGELEDIHMGILDKIMSNNNLFRGDVQVDIPYCKNVGKAHSLIKAVLAGLHDDHSFADKLVNSTKGKLCFQNGVYDFGTKLLTPWSENADVYTTVVIDDDFNPQRNEVVERKVTDLLRNILGQDLDMFLKVQSRGLAGHTEDKKWTMLGGERNSGKGVYVLSMEEAFPGYITIINSGCLMLGHSSSGDEAKKMSWVMEMNGARLAFSQELAINEDDKEYGKQVKIDGTILKKLASGGDTLLGRKLFMNETSFKSTSSITILFNDAPSVSPADALETMIMFRCPYKYVDQQYLSENPHIPSLRLANPYLKDELREKDFKDSLRHILFDHYSTVLPPLSAGVLKNKSIYQGNDEFLEFHNDFKVGLMGKDRVTYPDIKRYIECKRLNASVAKLKGRLIEMGGVEKRSAKAYYLTGVKMIWKGDEGDEDI